MHIVREWEAEIIVVLEGRGVVSVKSKEKETRVEVEAGDVVAVPRLYPVAQLSFNDGSFVFMGLTRATKMNKPEFLAGKSSLLQIINKQGLQLAFNVQRQTIDRLLAPPQDDDEFVVISPCISCAEQQEMRMEMEGEAGWPAGRGSDEYKVKRVVKNI